MKRKLISLFLAALMLGATLLVITSCFGKEEDPPAQTVYLLKDETFEHAIVTDNKDKLHRDLSTKLATKLVMDYLVNNVERYDYTEKTSEKEILFGETDRQLSKDLKAEVDAKAAKVGFAWGYAYRDGKLAYYANSEEAVTVSFEEFLDLICKESTVEVMSNLWVVDGMTLSEYEEMMREQQEQLDKEQAAIRKEKIADLKERIAAITASFPELPDFTPIFGKPSMYPSYSHPRVWVNGDTLPTVKSNLTHKENAEAYSTLLDNVDLEYTGRLDKLKTGENRNFTDVDYAKIEVLAFMYLVTGDELYGYSAIRAAKNFLSTLEVRPNKSSWNGDQLYDISNSCSTAMGVMAEVYDWCYPLLHANDRDFIVYGCVGKLAPTLEVKNPPVNTGSVSGHSVSTLILRDWLSFAIAVADEYPLIYERIVGVIENEYAKAPNWYYPSGSNWQGSAYGINKTYLHLISEMLVKIATGEKLYADDVSFEATTLTYIHYLRPDEESLRIGDDYRQWGFLYRPDNRMSVYGYFYYKNPILKSWAISLTAGFRAVDFSGLLEITPIKILIFNDPTLEYKWDQRYDLPLVNYNGEPVGALVARSAWGDPDAWMTYTNLDGIYGANHDHRDAGAFQIYYKGILAPTSSCYQYMTPINGGYGSHNDLAYNKQTISKNSLLIYNPDLETSGRLREYSGGQSISDEVFGENDVFEHWTLKSTFDQADELGHSWGYDKSGALTYAYISGDITRAYDQETVDLVMRSTISIATGNEDHPLLFIVYDRVTSDNAAFKKTYLLHTTGDPSFIGSPSVSTDKNGIKTVTGSNVFYYTNVLGASGEKAEDDPADKYNGKLTATTLLPENPVFTVIGGDGKRFWVNGRNVGEEEDINASPVTEIGWGRVELSPSVKSLTDSFLNVMYVGDADKNDTYVPATLVKNDTHEGAISFGNCVMFSKSNKLIVDEFTLNVSSDSTLTYYVSGLSNGKWNVSLDGNHLTDIVVADGAGIATFKAAGGQLKFTPAFQKVSFELNGGKCNKLPGVYNTGEETVLPTPEKYGSEFVGWYESLDFSGSPVTKIGADATGTKVYYAKWNKLFDIVTYHLNGGSVNGELVTKLDPGTTVTLPTDVTLTNAVFEGWYSDDTYTEQITEIVACGEDFDVYAKFTVYIETPVTFKDTADQLHGLRNQIYGNIIAEDPDGAITMRFVADKDDLASERDGNIRVRTNTGSHAVLPIILKDNDIISCDNEVISNYANGDVIDIVMDFDDFEMRYYINGNYLKTVTGVGYSSNLESYNFNIGGLWTYLWQYDSGLKDSDFTVSVIKGDAMKYNKGFGIVTVDPVGGAVNADSKYKYFNGDTVTLPTATKYGSEFLGWYTTPDYQGEPVTEITSEIAKDITVYAKWQKLFSVVKFNTDGGTISGEFDATLVAGKTLTLPTMVTKEGYLFVGWYRDKYLNYRVSEIKVDSVEEDIEVYAGFIKAVESQLLTASGPVAGARLNYASIINGTDDKCITMVLILDNSALTTQRNGVIRIRSNDGQNAVIPIQIVNNDVKDMNGNVIATYNDNSRIDITLDFDDREVSYYVDGEYVVTYGDVGFAGAIGLYDYSSAPTYKYLWQFFTDLGSNFAIAIAEGNLHADDLGYGKLSFNTNGGELEGGDRMIYLGDEEITLPIPTREGYEFLGWFNNAELSGDAVVKIAEGDVGEKKFYAGWRSLYRMVEYVTDGGTVIGNANTQIIVGETITLPLAVYKAGFLFEGWYLDEAKTQPVKTIEVESDEDIRVYAKYTPCVESSYYTDTQDQLIGAKNLMYGDMLNTSNGMLTFTFVADSSDLNSTRKGVIRVRTNGGKNEIHVIKLDNNDICNADGKRIAGYEDNARIDIVADFINGTLRYYVNGEYNAELDASVAFNEDLSLYNFNIGGSWTYLWQYNAQGTDSDFFFSVSKGDIYA